jgi:hypothetical protein
MNPKGIDRKSSLIIILLDKINQITNVQTDVVADLHAEYRASLDGHEQPQEVTIFVY